MKEKIVKILQGIIGQDAFPPDVSVPEKENFGHYSTNIALRLSGGAGGAEKPLAWAERLAAEIRKAAPAGFFEKVEAAPPGFINFWLSPETIQKKFGEISREESFGTNGSMKGKTVMVEFTDPNPFKLFHIGHLMSNTIGESLARLYEAAGATVRRADYYGDVGLHIAKAIWGMEQLAAERPDEKDDAAKKMDFLGRAYALGSRAYEEKPESKEAIIELNKKIYERSDAKVNQWYDAGLAWSLAYFETVFKRLGTKFDDYFPESDVGKEGLDLVLAHKDIFMESDGAIVFPGEQYGLHTRVFVNAQGLPTYEAKELGLNRKKFKLYPLDLSIVVTGNEIVDYFKVLLKAMELIMPEVAAKTKHVAHGMLRLPTGKMSSRTGEVVTAASLIDDVKAKLAEYASGKMDLTADERAAAAEVIAIGAVKYSILKQHPGQDIVFDFGKSLSFEGDSGPYLQYAYARLRSILRKAGGVGDTTGTAEAADFGTLTTENELMLMRKIFAFPDAVRRAQEMLAPSGFVAYLYQLAAVANKFYETTPILKDENVARRNARLALAATAARVLKKGLALLGIGALEKI
ncbi:MAG: arginine--tRNA ligase [Minisyncoccia bacterium]|jgi:arginyl-tRNA synthetase